jgi:alanine transaminase
MIGLTLRLRPSIRHPCFRFLHRMPPLTIETVNPAFLKVEYAVRGELAIKAEKYRNELKDVNNTLPFKKVISSNIGNPQQKGLDQPPITFTRQVRSF